MMYICRNSTEIPYLGRINNVILQDSLLSARTRSRLASRPLPVQLARFLKLLKANLHVLFPCSFMCSFRHSFMCSFPCSYMCSFPRSFMCYFRTAYVLLPCTCPSSGDFALPNTVNTNHFSLHQLHGLHKIRSPPTICQHKSCSSPTSLTADSDQAPPAFFHTFNPKKAVLHTENGLLACEAY